MWTTLFLYFVLPVCIGLCILRLESVQKFLEPLRNWLYYSRFTSLDSHSHSHGEKQCNKNDKCTGQSEHGHGHSHEHGHHGHHDQKHSKESDQAKTILFQDLKTTHSKVKGLGGQGNIRILEIGVGPGANFKYYPEKCQYVGVDPNPKFRQDVMDNMKKFPGIELVDFLHTVAEEMDSIPNESVDAVVTTAVLCSVKDIQKVFREIRRVLVPGGKYYFLEHIAEESNTKEYWMQRIVTFAHYVMSFIGLMHEAHLDRKIDQEVLKAGFSSVDQKYSRFEMKGGSVIQKLAERRAIGVAMK